MIITRLGGLPLNFLRPISSARAYFTAKNSPGVQRKKPPAIGIKASYPGFIAPALATSSDEVPKGERWIHEINFDGYRVQLHIANESTTVFTRRGIDWTRRFKKIANVAFLINASSAVIDGEIVVPAADGTHGLFGAAERTQGQVNEDRDGRVRPALSQRLRPGRRSHLKS
jgi:ATP-dependent DNA ligase